MQLEELFEIDFESWIYEVQGTGKFFESFGEKLPAQLEFELIQLEARLRSSLGAKVSS
jgi:GTP-dependent phosphoenolpyruvate carboxykinase